MTTSVSFSSPPPPPIDPSTVRSLLLQAIPPLHTSLPSPSHPSSSSPSTPSLSSDPLHPPLKTLPELLAALGNPSSCPYCSVPLARVNRPLICLACGKYICHVAGATWKDQWKFDLGGCEGGEAERRFVESLGLEGEKKISVSSLDPSLPYAVPDPSDFTENLKNTKNNTENTINSGEVFVSDDDFFLGGNVTSEKVPMGQLSPFLSVAPSPSPLGGLHMFGSHSPRGSGISLSSLESEKEDFFSQLSGLGLSSSSSLNQKPVLEKDVGSKKEVENLLKKVTDLSFMLTNHLTVPEKDPGNKLVFPFFENNPSLENGNGNFEEIGNLGNNGKVEKNENYRKVSENSKGSESFLDKNLDKGDDLKDEWGDFAS